MRVTMIDAISADGFIDRDGHEWTSAEDWDFFVKMRASSDVMVMGAATYDAIQPKPSAGLLRLVLTNYPERYAGRSVKGQLEFTTATPKVLGERLANEGYKTVLIAGGSVVNHDFLEAGMVDDIYLTFEPVLLGKGVPLISGNVHPHVKLSLQSIKQLNVQGSLLVHYKVDR